MSRVPDVVVTGVHVPKVDFWVRVLVRPDRLRDVKNSILKTGRADLMQGEFLQIDTDPGDGIERAVTVGDPDAQRPWVHGIVAWSETASEVTVYASSEDHLESIAEPVVEALIGRNPHELMSKAVWLHSDRINSIHVGGVHIHFERSEDKDRRDPEDDRKASHGMRCETADLRLKPRSA